jgi:hypothetical protein
VVWGGEKEEGRGRGKGEDERGEGLVAAGGIPPSRLGGFMV